MLSVRWGEISLTGRPIRNLLQLFKQKVMKAEIKTIEGQRRGLRQRYMTEEEFTGFNDH